MPQPPLLTRRGICHSCDFMCKAEQHQLDFLSLFPQSGADAFWGPTKNVLSGLHGRTWLAPLLLLWPLVVFWTPVVSIVAGAWESHPAVLLAGFAAYAAEYATLWPSRSLFRFHPVKALFFPLAVISVWCCLLRALYHYLARGSIVWRGRAVKVR